MVGKARLALDEIHLSSRQHSLAPPQPPIACALAHFFGFLRPYIESKLQDELPQPCLPWTPLFLFTPNKKQMSAKDM